MKLYNISSAGTFLSKVVNCTGGAWYVRPDGERADLKEMARFLIRTGMADQLDGIREIDLRLDNSADTVMLMNYAAQMN